jgi:hypothetical protein
MTRKCFLLTIVFCVSVPILARASDEIVPAGTLLQCTVSEPNFSSKTAQVGDPVLCYLGHVAAFGHPLFPRGAELSGHLEDYKNPGHFVGKGWMQVSFDRLILPGAQVLPLSAKVISAPHMKVDSEGKVHGKGHPKRDAILWAIPVFWPVKIITLPARGPYPAFKGETRLSLRLMEDMEFSLPAVRSSIPMPPRVTPSGYDSSSSALNRPIVPRQQNASLQPAFLQQPTQEPREPMSTVIVMKGGAAWLARNYWVEAGQLHCVSPDGEQKLVALETMDLYQTVRVNRERRVEFVLHSKDPVEQ